MGYQSYFLLNFELITNIKKICFQILFIPISRFSKMKIFDHIDSLWPTIVKLKWLQIQTFTLMGGIQHGGQQHEL